MILVVPLVAVCASSASKSLAKNVQKQASNDDCFGEHLQIGAYIK